VLSKGLEEFSLTFLLIAFRSRHTKSVYLTVTLFYQNVIGRQSDYEGKDLWTDRFLDWSEKLK